MLKILLIGLGSIGRRHKACLEEIGGVELAALRTSKGTLKDASGITEFFSVEESLTFKPDGVLIANPTSLHVSSALPYLQMGIPVLIEKPVAYSYEESTLLNEYSHLIRIAYCKRFHKLNEALTSILNNEAFFKVGFKRSYYLPKWHPYADYRTEYTAKKELGGGVIRTLSHEIDLMVGWFGKPLQVSGVVDKVSHLEIDTDDYAFFSCKYANGFRVNFELDFFSPVNISIGEIYTEKGRYSWDNQNLWFSAYNDAEQHVTEAFDTKPHNDMYHNQMRDFLEFVKTGKSKNSTLEEAQEVLQLIEKLNG